MYDITYSYNVNPSSKNLNLVVFNELLMQKLYGRKKKIFFLLQWDGKNIFFSSFFFIYMCFWPMSHYPKGSWVIFFHSHTLFFFLRSTQSIIETCRTGGGIYCIKTSATNAEKNSRSNFPSLFIGTAVAWNIDWIKKAGNVILLSTYLYFY